MPERQGAADAAGSARPMRTQLMPELLEPVRSLAQLPRPVAGAGAPASPFPPGRSAGADGKLISHARTESSW